MNTLFDKIWDSHIVSLIEDGPTQLYIDRLYCHEVTSPQAFDGLRARGIKCLRPERPSWFVLKGRGWGHGVGLCQIGAAVMGEKGFKYNAILLHYYTGAEIAKAY